MTPTIPCEGVQIVPHGAGVQATLLNTGPEALLRCVTIPQVIAYYGPQALLEAMDIQHIRQHLNPDL